MLLLVSYSVRDILWLRWFAVAAALTNIPYFLSQPETLWPPVFWAGVFTSINLYQIARIYLERRPVVLSEDEQKLYDMGFHSLRPSEFVFAGGGRRVEECCCRRHSVGGGEPVSSVCSPISGSVQVRKHGKDLGAFGPGQLIGTELALTGDPSPVDVTFTEPGRYMCWPLYNIRSFLDKRPELRTQDCKVS
jgi:CRP-like cAMP-binding protein